MSRGCSRFHYTANIFDKMIRARSSIARGLIEKVGGVEVLWVSGSSFFCRAA
jgi:hypothetical protein